MTTDKVYIGLEHAPLSFDLCGHVLGVGGANLEFIRSETGAMVILKGGSGDKMNPLHLAVSHTRPERLAAARSLALSLVESVRQEFQQWSAQNATAPPPLNMPPPMIVNQLPPANVNMNIPAPNVISSMPPPSVQAPINVQPQQQMLQLVPQQQIFVGPDGSHYVKVSVAQTPNAVGPLTTVPAVVNVVQHPPPMQPQISFTAPPPSIEILSGVATPTVCSAPTLSTPTNTLGRSGGQPWSASQQAQPVPAPVQVNSAPAANIPLWHTQAQTEQDRTWGEPKPTNQQSTNQANLPWYKNSQNPSQNPKPVEFWNESSSQNNGGLGKPAWDSGSGTSKAAMPDLLEEIKQDKDADGDVSKLRENRGAREYGRERKRDSGRPDSRRDRRRRYTDVEVYQKQFRSAGVLGDERRDEDEKQMDGEVIDQQNQQSIHSEKPRREPRGSQVQRGTADSYTGVYNTLQNGQTQASMGPTAHVSKWDRPTTDQSPTKGSTHQYNLPNYYQQPPREQYQHQQQYSQSAQQQYTQSAQQQYAQSVQQQYALSAQQQKTQQQPQTDSHDKQTPTTQYVGAPTNYTPPQQSYDWSSQTNQYQQSQHPWNRNTQDGQYAGSNQQRPWNVSPLAPPPPPPAFEKTQNYWPGSY